MLITRLYIYLAFTWLFSRPFNLLAPPTTLPFWYLPGRLCVVLGTQVYFKKLLKNI